MLSAEAKELLHCLWYTMAKWWYLPKRNSREIHNSRERSSAVSGQLILLCRVAFVAGSYLTFISCRVRGWRLHLSDIAV